MNANTGWIPRLSQTSGYLGQAAMAFMVVSLFYDVLMRYLFAAPTNWALEVNSFLLLFVCTIPTADVLKSNVHIHVTFLTERLPKNIVARLPILRASAGIVFCAAMTWKGSVMAWQAWQHNDRMSTSLGTPMFIPYLFLPLGFTIIGLQYAAMLKSGFAVRAPEGDTGQQI
jgi:TRAP-type C4-dicarboxylate transport system permease small subunit